MANGHKLKIHDLQIKPSAWSFGPTVTVRVDLIGYMDWSSHSPRKVSSKQMKPFTDRLSAAIRDFLDKEKEYEVQPE